MELPKTHPFRNIRAHNYYSTTDYHVFNTKKYNRPVSRFHVDKIKKSVEKLDLLFGAPILVCDNYGVMDGQHRLQAAAELGKEIYFIMDPLLDQNAVVQLNQAQHNWVAENYLHYYCELGMVDYMQFRGYMTKMGWTVTNMLTWIVGRNREAFLEGRFKWEPSQETLVAMHTTEEFIAILQKENRFAPSTLKNQQAFHTACKKFFTSPLVDHKYFIKKVAQCPRKLAYCANWKDYLTELIEVYNYHRLKSGRLRVAFHGANAKIGPDDL